MIAKIKIENVKETLNEDIKLNQHNLLTGTLGSGKTTILDAVQIGAIGKMLSEDFKGSGHEPIFSGLCTGGESKMSVGIESDNLSFNRGFERKNGKITQSLEIPNENLKGVQKCTPVINKTFGNSIFDVRVLKNDPDYVKEVLLSHCKSDNFSVADIPRKIISDLADEFINAGYIENAKEFIPDEKELFEKACGKLKDKGVPFGEVTSNPNWQKKDGEDIFTFVARLIESVIEQRKESARNVQTEKKALTAMSNDFLFSGTTGSVSTLREIIGKLETDLQDQIKKKVEAGENNRKIAEYQNAIDKIEKVMPERQSLKNLEQNQKEIEISIAKAENLRNLYTGKLAEVRIVAERYQNNQSRIAEIEKQCNSLANEIKSAPKSNLVVPDNAENVCRFIIEKDYICDQCKEVIDDFIADVKNYNPGATSTGDLQKKIDSLQTEKSLLQKENGKTAIADLKDSKESVKNYNRDCVNYYQQRDRIIALKANVNKHDELNQKLDNLIPVDVTEIENLTTGMQTALTEKRNELESMVSAKTEKANYQKHQLELINLEVKTTMFKCVETALKTYYNDMVNYTLQPVCENVNKGLKAIAADWNFYIEMDSRGRLMFGVNKQVKGTAGKMIKTPYRSLSGSESVFTRNILGTVLLSYSDSQEKILIDEIAEVSADIVPHFLTTMSQLTGDVIQCIYATCHKCEVPESWLEIPRGK